MHPQSPVSSVNVSPASSPAFGPVDSSPPSSPGLVPCSLDLAPLHLTAPFSHPFAASTKANKRLPSYEKKADSQPCTPPGTFTLRSVSLCRNTVASRSLQEDDFLSDHSLDPSPPSCRISWNIDREERIWDDALHKPFDTGIGQIDLSNQKLKYIPPSISDLSGFFNTPQASEQCLFPARVWTRVNTEPSRTRSFERAQSITDSGKERHVLKLYLMGNLITSLPPELFSVKNLTVLSLRANKLTYIPPDICLLTNLHELNISNNMLKFLPWQMRDMKIERLMVNPNPFLPEPETDLKPIPDLEPEREPNRSASLLGLGPPPRSPLRMRRSVTRLWALRKEPLSHSPPVLSPVTYALGPVPPLTELCLRLLLAPSPSSAPALPPAPPSAPTPAQTVLVEYYGFPLSDAWNARVPPSVRRTLTECIPNILRPPPKRISIDPLTTTTTHPRPRPCTNTSPHTSTGTSTCPNPTHRGRVFTRHAAERFTWERRVAGVDVGGAVPLRWRGCLRTCLDFLEAAGPVGVRPSPSPSSSSLSLLSSASAGSPLSVFTGGERRDGDGDGDVDGDRDVPEMAVQAVDLARVHLDMDDFDDEMA